jgi:hypothetical protein
MWQLRRHTAAAAAQQWPYISKNERIRREKKKKKKKKEMLHCWLEEEDTQRKRSRGVNGIKNKFLFSSPSSTLERVRLWERERESERLKG